MALNVDQKEVYSKLIKREKGSVLIQGHAGTGKTYLAISIVKKFLRMGKAVEVLCPTHQAKQQFTKKLEHNKEVKLNTVASFLSQFPSMNERCELIFRKGGEPSSGESHLIVVDECSMISEYEMKQIHATSEDCLVIFLGDYAQLLPVMKKQGSFYNKLETYTLTKQQRNSNNILKLCTQARTATTYPSVSKLGITVYDTELQHYKAFLQKIQQAKHPYDVCYLAYRNKTVNDVRLKIHKALYGKEEFVKGQYVRLDQQCIIGTTGSILKILRVVSTQVEYIGEIYLKTYTLKAKNIDTKEIGEIVFLGFEQQKVLAARMQELYAEASASFKKDRDRWKHIRKEIMYINAYLVFISSPFVQTVHKAQGRSIPTVFVNTKDISTASGKKRLLYVAYSRAIDELHTIRV